MFSIYFVYRTLALDLDQLTETEPVVRSVQLTEPGSDLPPVNK